MLELAEREAEPCVLASLAFAFGYMEDARAAAVLLRLAEHPDADVREETARALPSVVRDVADQPELLAALIELTRDEDAGEAVRGLVQLGDPRGTVALKRELENDPAWMVLEAAEDLRDPALLPALQALRDRGWAEDDWDGRHLDRALAACGGSG